MKVLAVCRRLPEDLIEYSPLIAEREGKRAILIHKDVDGSKLISLEEAAEIIGKEIVERAKTIKDLNLWWTTEDRVCV